MKHGRSMAEARQKHGRRRFPIFLRPQKRSSEWRVSPLTRLNLL
ncbi:MAG: hypothetical protein RIE73_11080 [Coleofasciculus sp. C1-SOL-03]